MVQGPSRRTAPPLNYFDDDVRVEGLGQVMSLVVQLALDIRIPRNEQKQMVGEIVETINNWCTGIHDDGSALFDDDGKELE